MKKSLSLFLLVISFFARAQDSGEFTRFAEENATGATAYETTAYVEQFWRLAGNPGFDSSIHYLVRQLEAAGFVPESEGPAPFTYRLEERPMDHPAWHPADARVTLEGSTEPLLAFSANRNMLAINSHSTPSKSFEIVRIHDLEELPEHDLSGKVVYADMSPYYLYRSAVVEFGAAGILTYEMPDYLRPEVNQHSIQFRRIPYSDSLNGWSVALSYAAREKLNQYLDQGGNTATVFIDTKFIRAPELTLIAQVHGTSLPEEELVISAHVQEPGANDNASGVGAALEIARILADNEIRPARTITFLWGDEITSTRRYTGEHGDRIKWGFSLDMVGENTSVTGGTFLIEKMPDPSAIWTRGKDEHTEWGGRPIQKDQLQPHYLNDFAAARFRRLGAQRQWTVRTNPYEGGSDHVPFLQEGIPALLFWHFTDQFYHTDQDRMDKVSQETLRNVVTGTLESTLTLANGGKELALRILEEIEAAAQERLETEAALSRAAVGKGESRESQLGILETWTLYYQDVAETVADLSQSESVRVGIADVRRKIGEMGRIARQALR